MSGIGVTEVTTEELEEWNRMTALKPAFHAIDEYLKKHEGDMTALNKQVAGNHYKDQPIQPVEYIHANAIGYFEGNVIKYVSRWRKKNGIADLEKAKHYIELLIELESRKADAGCQGA